MTNHIHLIISTETNTISNLVRDIKKFSSKKIIESITDTPEESRKEWMLNLFKFAGAGNSNNKEFPRLNGRAGILETRLPSNRTKYQLSL